MSLYVLMGVMIIVFIAMNIWTKKSTKKRKDEHERMLNDQLVPGAWVHTRVGFFGRFVEIDGDVVILETPGGDETYWDKRMIASVGDLPFAAEEEIEAAPEDIYVDEVEEESDSSAVADDGGLDKK